MRGEVPDVLAQIPLGKAATVRSGEHVTVVAYGAAVALAKQSAEQLSSAAISVEVIDLQTIQPWDEAAVLASLTKTGHLVVVHEAVEAFGVGAEIAARMADVGFAHLKGPIVRLGAPFMPVPFSAELEAQYRPSVARLVAAIRKALGKE
jgi:pyruvate dehydrogenase E1 component beta subunit